MIVNKLYFIFFIKILNYLKNNDKYIQVKEYGKEYFQCDLKDLISEIYNLIL